MGNKRVKMNELDAAFAAILDDYMKDVTDDLEKDIRAAAKVTKDELRSTSPKSSRDVGHYADGWNYRTKKDHFGHVSVTVKNTSKPGLTHLLEKGHVGRDGKPVPAHPHIKPAAEKGIEELNRRLK